MAGHVRAFRWREPTGGYALRVKRSPKDRLGAFHGYLIVLGVTRYALRVKRSPMDRLVAFHGYLIVLGVRVMRYA